MFGLFCKRTCEPGRLRNIERKLNRIMSELTDANEKLDGLDGSLNDLAGDINTLVQLNIQLQEQIAAGQVDAALAAQINAKVGALAQRVASIDSTVEGATGVVTP